jgi:hypothetical protein
MLSNSNPSRHLSAAITQALRLAATVDKEKLYEVLPLHSRSSAQDHWRDSPRPVKRKTLSMENLPEERRRALRYPIEARVIVSKTDGETVLANCVNVSSSGILIEVEQPSRFQIGEEVTVELDLPNDADKALSVWGVGRVVRVDAQQSAIQLDAGSFHDLQASGRRLCR